MSRVLQTTSQRMGTEYPRMMLPMTGGLNPDAGDLIPPEDFSELHNFRKVVADEYELRTGYTRVDADNPWQGTPEWKCEYIVYDDALNIRYHYDVTIAYMFESSGTTYKMFAQLYNTLTGTKEYIDIVGGLTATPVPIAVAGQFQFMLMVSVYGVDTYAIYPQSYTPVPGNWFVRSIGKALALGPDELSFMEETEGDLVVFPCDNEAGDFHDALGYRSVGGNNGRLYVPKTDLSDQNRFTNGNKYYRVHLPIKAPYYRRDTMNDGALTPPLPPAQWAFPPTDADPVPADAHPSSDYHMQTRGWGYKIVLVREIIDPNGNKTTIYSAPSTDFWVRDSIYCPPQLWIPTKDARPWRLDAVGNGGSGTGARQRYDTYPNNSGGQGNIEAYPSAASMTTLLRRLIEYFGVLRTEDAPFDYSPTDTTQVNAAASMGGFYGHYALWWAGYRNFRGATQNTDFDTIYFNGQAPWWCDVPASYLKGAPMTVINWNDIKANNGGDNSIVEALIFRTAYCCPDEDDNDTWSPLFQPHKYGYIGSVKNPGLISNLSIFEDIVPDGEIDFGHTPEQYEGYLEGQLSGQVYTEYNAQAVLANLKTYYWVNAPQNVVGSATGRYVLFEPRNPVGGNVYTGAEFNGVNRYRFGYQYVDSDGNHSDIIRIWDATTVGAGAAEVHIGFTVPYGYAPNITSVRIYRLDANLVPLKLIKELSVTDGYYIHTTKDDEKDVPSDYLTKNTVTSTSPGSSVRSDVNTIFRFSPLNTELHHNVHQVMYMNVIMGRLWVLLDGAVMLTELNGRRAEPESPHIGLVSRYAAVKVDKIIVFLSQDGLYYLEASGPVLFPAKIQTEILQYLSENYDTDYAKLTNVRRVGFGYDGTRNELWMHFPRSTDYGGVLEHKTYVMKFLETARPENNVIYTFDLSKQFIWEENPASTRYSRISVYAKPERVIFASHSDGSLFASYKGTRPEPTMPAPPDTDLDIMVTLNCDNPNEVWRYRAMMEKRIAAGDPTLPKFLRSVLVRARAKAFTHIATGLGAVGDEPYRYTNGHIHWSVIDYAMTWPGLGAFESRAHIPVELIEKRGRILFIRFRSEPDEYDDHQLAVKTMTAFLTPTNVHYG